MASNKNRANQSGKRLEEWVARVLEDRGYEMIEPKWLLKPASLLDQSSYCSQYRVGSDVYGRWRRVDFFAYHPDKWPDGLIIQCKFQGSSGSVDEKLVFEAMSIDFSEIPAVVVLEGDGYSVEARNWLLEHSKEEGSYLLEVLRLGELDQFANTNL